MRPTLLALTLITALFTPAVAQADISTMSFNIRYDGGGADSYVEDTGWNYTCGPRSERVLATIEAFDPDILGVQEALDNQMRDVVLGLPEHNFYGVGRNDGATDGEFAAIFWRASRFVDFDSGTFWLSDTPDEPGTTFEGAAAVRIASWVILDDTATGSSYFVLNTHWDHVCNPCADDSAALIRERATSLAEGRPIIIMGDLNTTETQSAFTTLMGASDPAGFQLVDGYRELYPSRASNEATYHAFGGSTSGSRIDFVLATQELGAISAGIDHTVFSCGYPSDHFPVTVTWSDPGLGPVAAPPSIADDVCDPECEASGCNSAPGPVGMMSFLYIMMAGAALRPRRA